MHLLAGQALPAHPLALTPRRTLDERRQHALTRYYVDAGAGGIAVGVHTTQFAIRDPAVGLFRPVLELAAEAARDWLARGAPPEKQSTASAAPAHNPRRASRTKSSRDFALIAGVCGPTRQAVAEAATAQALGYHAVLVSLGGLADLSDAQLVRHCRAVADVLPIVGFYLQPAVGGRSLGFRFWRELAEIPALVAIKIAPFNRYATLDVVRAVAEAGREDVALYTGNDDNIVADLLTPIPCRVGGQDVTRYIVGGLLGQWAVWTRRAVDLVEGAKRLRGKPIPPAWLRHGAALTDANGAIFDATHGFAGCIPGIHEVLRRTGLLRGTWCLNPRERLSPGQSAEIDRVMRSYPDLHDDDWVAGKLDDWLA